MRVAKEPAKCESDVRLLLWIARGAIPFTTFDLPEFKKWTAHHGLATRSGDHLRRIVLPAVATHVREVFRERLKTAPAAAIVIDGWDLRKEKVVGIVVHRISDDWKLRSEVLGLMAVPGSHTGEALSGAVSARVEAFLGKGTTIAAAVSDNGPNYTKACDKIAGGEHWPCVLHTLQLVVRDIIGKTGRGRAKQLLEEVHDIVRDVRADSALRAELAAEQEKRQLTVLQLVMDNDTRWHSELAMLERFVELFEPLRSVLARHSFTLKSDNKSEYADIVDVLSRIRLHSRALETEAVVTISLVLPHLHKIRTSVLGHNEDDSTFKADFKRALRTQFEVRFGGTLLFFASALLRIY